MLIAPIRVPDGRLAGSDIDPSMSRWAPRLEENLPGSAGRQLDASYRERAMLSDGTSVALRPIGPADGPLLQACLEQLSDRSWYLRFHSPRAEFSGDVLRYFNAVDGEMHFALAAFAPSSRRLVAVGQFIRGGAAFAAEIALVVADALQGKGLGLLLISRLREAALERSVTRFTGSVLEENHPMRDLLRKLGARVGLPSRGVCEIELALA